MCIRKKSRVCVCMSVYNTSILFSSSCFQVYNKQSVDDRIGCLSQGTSIGLSSFMGMSPVQWHRACTEKGLALGLRIAAAVLTFLISEKEGPHFHIAVASKLCSCSVAYPLTPAPLPTSINLPKGCADSKIGALHRQTAFTCCRLRSWSQHTTDLTQLHSHFLMSLFFT